VSHLVFPYDSFTSLILFNLYPPLRVGWLVTNVPFQHKYGYIRDEKSGVESYPYPVKEGQRYINLNPGKRAITLQD